MKKSFKRLLALLIVLATVGGCTLYVCDYYPTDGEAILSCLPEDGTATYEITEGGLIVAKPENPVAGFIFYPGGKVEHSAYLPLAMALAERGVLTVICPMPLRLAVLDVNAAEGVRELFPDITDWYIGGHSLGGSMAAGYLKSHPDFSGLVLLGSYSTYDVRGSRVLSIYGSHDGVMQGEKYEKYKSNLPSDLSEVIIEGGNHAYFGCYGEQKGDGRAEITNARQITLTAEIISEFIKK
jgi:hypothetical protein